MGEKRLQVIIDNNGSSIVVIPDIIFKNKQNINWHDVENYLQQYVGLSVEVLGTKDIVHIGKKFMDEYAGSKYTATLKGANAKAKANAVQGIVEMIEIANNKCFSENTKQKHFSDAGKGWYYYRTRFALPVYINEEKTDVYNTYKGCFVINHASNGKLYLYDLVDIKKEASTPLKTNV
jgi:hypothetical protein